MSNNSTGCFCRANSEIGHELFGEICVRSVGVEDRATRGWKRRLIRTIGMSRYLLHILILTVVACGAVGCRTAESPDVVHYRGGLPVWVFISTTPLDSNDLQGFPAQIARAQNQVFTTNRIEVEVEGDVIAPGTFHLPSGSTVLQAIVCAGGFTEFAYTGRLWLTRQSRHDVKLYLNCRFVYGGRYREVWYETRDNGNSATDYPLEDGDQIGVPRIHF